MRRSLTLAVFLLLGCGAVQAQDEEPRQIAINAVKNPEMRSYRAIWKGLDEFDNQHALAPSAPALRFRVITRGTAGKADEPLQARIASDERSAMIPIEADGRFTVPRDQVAYDARADLLLNRKKGSFRILPDVRSAGLPDDVRRLGDLRLECKVMVAVAKEEAPLWVVALVNSILLTGDWCSRLGENGNMSYKFPGPLRSAVLTDGVRTQPLEVHGSEYRVPVGANDWPDDALIRLEHAPQP